MNESCVSKLNENIVRVGDTRDAVEKRARVVAAAAAAAEISVKERADGVGGIETH